MGNAPTNNLPGVNVTLNDLGLRLAPPDEGPKVTIIGVASNPVLTVNEPLRVISSDTAIDSLFYANNGNVFTGASGQKWPSELSLAVEAAFNAGATNVEVMVTALRTGVAITGQSFETRYNELATTYNALKNAVVDIVVPAGYYFDEPEGLSINDANYSGLNFGKQLADFCYQATKDANSAIGVIELMPPLRLATWINHVLNSGSAPASSIWGYTGRFTSYQDWLFDTPALTTVDSWINFLNTTESQLYMTGTGPTGSSTYSGRRFVNSKLLPYLQGSELSPGTINEVHAGYLTDWQAFESDGARAIDAKGNKVDAGSYIAVVAAPLRAFSSQARRLGAYYGRQIVGNYYNSGGAASVAGRLTTLLPHHSITNKTILDIGPARILGRTQADKLVGRRFITFLLREPGFIVAKGVTGARNAGKYARSDYVFLSTTRVVHAAVDTVRAVSEKYIGVAASPQTRNAMDQEIRSRLDQFKERGAIIDYDISITATPEQNVLGEADVALSIVPATELVKINLTVNLQQTLS